DDADLGFGPELPRERQAVRTGEADIQEDDIHVAAGEHLACLLDRPGLAHRMPFLCQVAGQQRACHRIVVDDENPRLVWHHRSPISRSHLQDSLVYTAFTLRHTVLPAVASPFT